MVKKRTPVSQGQKESEGLRDSQVFEEWRDTVELLVPRVGSTW